MAIPSVTSLSTFILLAVAAFTLNIFINSPISPDPLQFPPHSAHNRSPFQGLEKLGEGLLIDPEDIAVDEKNGILYAASRDGWIKRMYKNGTWEDWVRVTTKPTLLGIALSASGKVLVCDAEKGQGLLEVGDDGVKILASHVEGKEISFAEDVIEASDGSIYFSVASSKFPVTKWYLDFLEAKPSGKLLKYDRSSKQTTVLLDHLGFGTGVALSKEEDYVIACEFMKCIKYWLKGEKSGTTDIFVDNLPGSPDAIIPAPDGSFWIALPQGSPEHLRFIHNWRALKHLAAYFPSSWDFVSCVKRKGTVVKVGVDGKIQRIFEDPNGKEMSFITTALEYEDHLYLASMNSNFIGRIPLKTTASNNS